MRDWHEHRRALVVVAHPDDESFGLGAVLHSLTASGMVVDLVCCTHGEASTLGATADLGEQRRLELVQAGTALGLAEVTLLDLPDGGVAAVPAEELDAAIDVRVGDATLLVMFEPGGVTGHPDHRAVTASAMRIAARRRLATLEWGVSPEVATALRAELGAPFGPLEGDGCADVVVDRQVQLQAIACHHTQSADNPVLHRRLELQADRERVRYRSA